jgi:Mn-dependent DtxR family transcriptional regulator
VRLQESGEMYIESLYVLSKQRQFVRAIDIGEYMGYSKPSVSRALGLLKSGGFVTSDKDGYLFLTEQGLEVAEKMYERHTLLCEFLTAIGVDEQTANDDACKIEHVISDSTFEAIKKYALERRG